jgi:hypothetical protein
MQLQYILYFIIHVSIKSHTKFRNYCAILLSILCFIILELKNTACRLFISTNVVQLLGGILFQLNGIINIFIYSSRMPAFRITLKRKLQYLYFYKIFIHTGMLGIATVNENVNSTKVVEVKPAEMKVTKF